MPFCESLESTRTSNISKSGDLSTDNQDEARGRLNSGENKAREIDFVVNAVTHSELLTPPTGNSMTLVKSQTNRFGGRSSKSNTAAEALLKLNKKTLTRDPNAFLTPLYTLPTEIGIIVLKNFTPTDFIHAILGGVLCKKNVSSAFATSVLETVIEAWLPGLPLPPADDIHRRSKLHDELLRQALVDDNLGKRRFIEVLFGWQRLSRNQPLAAVSSSHDDDRSTSFNTLLSYAQASRNIRVYGVREGRSGIYVQDTSNKGHETRFLPGVDRRLICAAASDNGCTMISVSLGDDESGGVKVWDLSKDTASFRNMVLQPSQEPHWAHMSADGTIAMVAGRYMHPVLCKNSDNLASIVPILFRTGKWGADSYYRKIALASNGSKAACLVDIFKDFRWKSAIVVFCVDKWHEDETCPTITFDITQEPIRDIIFSPRGRFITIETMQRQIQIFDLRNNIAKKVDLFRRRTNARLTLPRFSMDEQYISFASRTKVYIVDLNNLGGKKRIFEHNGVISLDFSPQRSRLLTLSREFLRVMDLNAEVEQKLFVARYQFKYLQSAHFSANGAHITLLQAYPPGVGSVLHFDQPPEIRVNQNNKSHVAPLTQL